MVPYLVLVAATWALSLVVGAALFWGTLMSPWTGLIGHVSNWLIQFEPVARRYGVSRSFCGECADEYLFTVQILGALLAIYLGTLAFWTLGVRRVRRAAGAVRGPDQTTNKATISLLGLSAVLAAMIWSMLFWPDFARPSAMSPSNNVYSLYGFSLIFLVSTAFHILVTLIMACCLIWVHRDGWIRTGSAR